MLLELTFYYLYPNNSFINLHHIYLLSAHYIVGVNEGTEQIVVNKISRDLYLHEVERECKRVVVIVFRV